MPKAYYHKLMVTNQADLMINLDIIHISGWSIESVQRVYEPCEPRNVVWVDNQGTQQKTQHTSSRVVGYEISYIGTDVDPL